MKTVCKSIALAAVFLLAFEICENLIRHGSAIYPEKVLYLVVGIYLGTMREEEGKGLVG